MSRVHLSSVRACSPRRWILATKIVTKMQWALSRYLSIFIKLLEYIHMVPFEKGQHLTNNTLSCTTAIWKANDLTRVT